MNSPYKGRLVGKTLPGETTNQRYKRFRAEGRCGVCGEPPQGNLSRCRKCSEAMNLTRERKRQSWIQLSKCHRCGSDDVIECHVIGWVSTSKKSVEQRCLKCYLQKSALQYLGTGTRWKELLALYNKQEGKCAYTKLPITIGKDAHIDHKIPHLGKERLTDISNLQYVHYKVNLMKTGLSEEEFVNFCRLVNLNF